MVSKNGIKLRSDFYSNSRETGNEMNQLRVHSSLKMIFENRLSLFLTVRHLRFLQHYQRFLDDILSVVSSI